MNDHPWLHNPAEWSGHWWLPEDPDETRAGVLRYEPDEGLTLSLVDGFDDQIREQIGPGAFAVKGTRRWDVLHGVADNKQVTLFDCLPTSSTSYGMGFGAPAKQKVHAGTALVGVHLSSRDDAVFTGGRASIEGLTDWSGDSVFSMTLGLEDGDRLDGHGAIEATPVDGHTARYEASTLRLEHHHTLPNFEHRLGSTLGRMTDTAVLYIEPDEPASLLDLRQTVRAMQDLISLATHRAAGVLWIALSMPPEDRQRPEGYPTLPRVVSLYEKQTVGGDPDARAPTRGALFTLSDLPFETLVPRWLGIRDRFAATCSLLLGLRYVPGGYLETQLSQAVTAAEAMHRALDLEPPIPPDEFEVLRQRLRESVPKARREWLRDLLLHGNAPTLRERLLDLAAWPDAEAMAMLLPDPQRWATMTKDARNNLAHTGRSGGQDIQVLYAVSRVTNAVVLLNLLHEVGLSGERQRAILTNMSDLSTAVQLSRDYCANHGPEPS